MLKSRKLLVEKSQAGMPPGIRGNHSIYPRIQKNAHSRAAGENSWRLKGYVSILGRRGFPGLRSRKKARAPLVRAQSLCFR